MYSYMEISGISWKHVDIPRIMHNIFELTTTFKGTLKYILEHMRIIMNIQEHYMHDSGN